ncbi:MAG: hypothetical protein WC969_14595 [Elusimicrobiota bacterium]|jgi:hypothetical protein
MKGSILLLGLLLCGCAGVGTPKTAILDRGSRFAFFSGASPDGLSLPTQLKLERAGDLILDELAVRVRGGAPERFLAKVEVKERYGKSHLPIASPAERHPDSDAKDPSHFEDCDPRTAAYVRDRLRLDAFVVLWVTFWPPLEGIDAGEPLPSPLPQRRYIVQAFSTADCRSLGHWGFTFAADLLPRVHMGMGLDETSARAYAADVADKLVEELRVPLRLD